MRHRATAALIDYKDVIVVASVSCIYGIGYLYEMGIPFSQIKKSLSQNLKIAGRFEFFDEEIERIRTFDILTGASIDDLDFINIFSATHFVTNKEKLEEAIRRIEAELDSQVKKFNSEGKPLEAERILSRTRYDLEMLREIGTCSGVENYSRHLTLRGEGETPATLLDFFPKDFLLVIDESHATVPQIRGMYNGDRARKENLVNYGFRLPSALDNRPLKFDEFEAKVHNVLYFS